MDLVILTRKLDKLGRLVIPREMQRGTGMVPHTKVNMVLYGDRIIVEKHEKDVSRHKKPIGIIRALDELGRIVIACEMREELGIEPLDILFVILNGQQIFIEKTKSDYFTHNLN